MKFKKTFSLLAGLIFLLLAVPQSWADDFSTYNTALGYESMINPVVAGGDEGAYSWFTAMCYFPEDTVAMVGNYEAEGRIISATGTKLYIQRNYGSGKWDVIGTVGGTMDPCFVKVSPDGTKVALGIGYGAPLLIIPTSILDPDDPPVLHDGTNPHVSVTAYAVNYYDAAWADNQYLVINGGDWPGPPYGSGVAVLDTTDSSDLGTGLIGSIPGASGGVTVDSSGNLITGLGWATGPPNRTGELMLWNSSEWSTTPTGVILYSSGRLLANNVLSVAYLGTDREGNLTVGGGDAFGSGGLSENGYAALISNAVLARVAADPQGPPVNDGNKSDVPNEYRYFAPDPCQNDSATGIIASGWGRNIAVNWNPTNATCNIGAADDYWNPGIISNLTIYHCESALDNESDNDGIPDGSDNAYLTDNSGQEDTDDDGWANIADGDFNNDDDVNSQDRSMFRQSYGKSEGEPGYNSDSDMVFNGTVNSADRAKFRGRMGTSVPFY